MSNKVWNWISIILILVLSCILIWIYNRDTVSKESIEKIDSLETEISNIETKKDSVNMVIDTIYIKIKDNEKRYKENSINVINNSPNDDLLFFTDYIERNKSRFDSLYNL